MFACRSAQIIVYSYFFFCCKTVLFTPPVFLPFASSLSVSNFVPVFSKCPTFIKFRLAKQNQTKKKKQKNTFFFFHQHQTSSHPPPPSRAQIREAGKTQTNTKPLLTESHLGTTTSTVATTTIVGMLQAAPENLQKKGKEHSPTTNNNLQNGGKRTERAKLVDHRQKEHNLTNTKDCGVGAQSGR